MAAISFRGVEKTYDGGVRAVRDFDLEVAEGELLVLLGPSGCGKTTVLRLLAGLESPTRGEILVGDRRVDDLPAARRDVAMIFQNYALYPHMTVRQNLAFPLRMRRAPRPERDRRVQDAAVLLGLQTLLDKRPGQLSGGQQQRVAIGRALVREPAAFLMDEPLSNLDAQLRSRIRSELATLQRRLAITTLFVTHDQAEAMTLGHRVAVMREGSLQQIGTPDELYRRPANLFVASFVGQPAMNLLKAKVSVEGGVTHVHLREAQHSGTPAGQTETGAHLGASARLTLPKGLATEVSDSAAAVVLGLRPEALRLADPAHSDLLTTGTVQAVESLGPERLVHVTTALAGAAAQSENSPATVVVRVSSDAPAPRTGEIVGVTAAVTDLYVFAPDGRALNPRAG